LVSLSSSSTQCCMDFLPPLQLPEPSPPASQPMDLEITISSWGAGHTSFQRLIASALQKGVITWGRDWYCELFCDWPWFIVLDLFHHLKVSAELLSTKPSWSLPITGIYSSSRQALLTPE
jgi:hypothetical protein